MSIKTDIQRLTNARTTIRSKLVELGLATSTAKLDALANAVSGITNRGAVSAEVEAGNSYTIPAGYHNGTGTVSAVGQGSGEAYKKQAKAVTPTKSQQSVTPDSGYFGLSGVTVNAIPEAYQDVSDVTADAGDVLASKVIVDNTGAVTGTMPNNGAVSKTLDVTTGNQTYTVPKGYHSGSGTVNIVTEVKTATPSTVSQEITPTVGKVLSKVTVAAIPSTYTDVTGDTGTADDVLSGKTVHTVINGVATKVTGTIRNNGATGGNFDGINTVSFTIPEGYTTGGTVSLTDDIENALSEI